MGLNGAFTVNHDQLFIKLFSICILVHSPACWSWPEQSERYCLHT